MGALIVAAMAVGASVVQKIHGDDAEPIQMNETEVKEALGANDSELLEEMNVIAKDLKENENNSTVLANRTGKFKEDIADSLTRVFTHYFGISGRTERMALKFGISGAIALITKSAMAVQGCRRRKSSAKAEGLEGAEKSNNDMKETPAMPMPGRVSAQPSPKGPAQAVTPARAGPERFDIALDSFQVSPIRGEGEHGFPSEADPKEQLIMTNPIMTSMQERMNRTDEKVNNIETLIKQLYNKVVDTVMPNQDIPRENLEQPARVPPAIMEWRIENIDYHELTVAEKNNIRAGMENMIATRNRLTKDKVTVTLSAGSLVVSAEVDAAGQPTQWPTLPDVQRAAELARDNPHWQEPLLPAPLAPTPGPQRDLLRQDRPSPAPEPTVADRIGRQEPARPQAWTEQRADDTYATYNPQGIGFRLVTEKSLNMTKLKGEQDAHGKISYMKWARQMQNFIKSKGWRDLSCPKQWTGQSRRADLAKSRAR